jgi:DNA gyrase subunit A
VADIRIMGRATQGVRLINLEKRNDEIASVCKVLSEIEEEIVETINAEDNTETESNQDIITEQTEQTEE